MLIEIWDYDYNATIFEFIVRVLQYSDLSTISPIATMKMFKCFAQADSVIFNWYLQASIILCYSIQLNLNYVSYYCHGYCSVYFAIYYFYLNFAFQFQRMSIVHFLKT